MAFTRCAVDVASDGYRTVEPCTARIAARSSSAICDGPSSPISTPACEPQRRMLASEIAAIRMKSYARERKAAKVDAKDRKSTRLNSSHVSISYAVFCLKKKNKYRVL